MELSHLHDYDWYGPIVPEGGSYLDEECLSTAYCLLLTSTGDDKYRIERVVR